MILTHTVILTSKVQWWEGCWLWSLSMIFKMCNHQVKRLIRLNLYAFSREITSFSFNLFHYYNSDTHCCSSDYAQLLCAMGKSHEFCNWENEKWETSDDRKSIALAKNNENYLTNRFRFLRAVLPGQVPRVPANDAKRNCSCSWVSRKRILRFFDSNPISNSGFKNFYWRKIVIFHTYFCFWAV